MKLFYRNKLALAGMVYIILVLLFSVFAYFIGNDRTTNCNDIQMPLAGMKPGTKVDFYVEDHELKANFFEFLLNGDPEYTVSIPISSYFIEKDTAYLLHLLDAGRNLSKSEMKKIPLLGNVSKFSEHIVSKTFWFGTDASGRDVLSRLLLGARISVFVGFVSVIISLFIGIISGALAGYYGGITDKVLMWFMSVMWSLPSLLIVIALSVALGKGFYQLFIAIGLTMWVDVARLVRGQFLSLKEKEFVEAARLQGISNFSIIFRHMLPVVKGTIIVVAVSNFATAILLEAGLSFLGLGVQSPVPSWGNMVKDNAQFIVSEMFYLALIPGMALMLLVMSFNFAGIALRDYYDVKSARE